MAEPTPEDPLAYRLEREEEAYGALGEPRPERPSGLVDISAADHGLPAPLGYDVWLLDSILGEILREQLGEERFAQARALLKDPWDPQNLPQDPVAIRQIARAFTLYFQLVNTAEQKEIVRVNRDPRRRVGGVRRESIRDAANHVHSALRDHLHSIEVCPTLTAHPTEAKRRAVLDKLLNIADELAGAPRLESSLDEAQELDARLRQKLSTLWQTDEMRSVSLTVEEEVRNALYFFERTIFDVVAWLHEDLQDALVSQGVHEEVPVCVRFRSWVGGDRDGNPLVTPQVTADTLEAHRRTVLEIYLQRAADLRREITISSKLVGRDVEFAHLVEAEMVRAPLADDRISRYAQEPYVLRMLQIESRLQATLDRIPGRAYESADELVRDLAGIRTSLQRLGISQETERSNLTRLLMQARIFGFHMASLDIRQHSEAHEAAVSEMFRVAGVCDDYATRSEDLKLEILRRELASPRPLLGPDAGISDHLRQTLEVFQVVKRARRELGPESVKAYIVSMTHGVSDLLEVLLLAKECGLAHLRLDGLVSEIEVVPLFETIDDLRRSGELLEAWITEPSFRPSLEAMGLRQEVMLGYSDSSKDGGFLAANWSLHSTQACLAEVAQRNGVAVRFFHGRGGTVGRGGGRANRAILSQPPGSFDGQIRFTEQGEVISFRYSMPAIAHRHLEQIVGAALMAVDANAEPEPPEFLAAMAELSERSREAYRALVYDDPEFWGFYNQATPIDFISLLPIASRPVFRPGKALQGIDQLRAIPWNFAWVQSRYVMVGWYGLGSAMESWLDDPEKLALLRWMYRDWPFFRTVLDNAQLELCRAQLSTARRYADRVKPAEMGDRFHQLLLDEHSRSVRTVEAITERPLLERAPVVRRTIAFRNPAVEPLNAMQLQIMDRWDSLTAEEQAGPWREAALQTIAGLAAAMQSTG